MISNNTFLLSVTLSTSVERIDDEAFANCVNLHKVGFSSSLKAIGDRAFWGCSKLEEIILPSFVESIGNAAFFGHITTKLFEIHSSNISLPENKLAIFQNAPVATSESPLFAPHLSLEILNEHGLALQAAKTFIERYEEYDPVIAKEYINFISSSKNKYLPLVLERDEVEIIKRLCAENKITDKNYEKSYLLQAKQAGASKCEAFLVGQFGEKKTPKTAVNTLWNGVNFSFDGKKLLKYSDMPGCDKYYVPEGTKEILSNAFFMTSLRAVFLPESVTTIRNGSFVAKGGVPLFVKLPNSLKKLPSEAFMGGFWHEDNDRGDYRKYYYVSTSSVKFAEQTSCSSYNKGEQCPVYTGGPLDDLSQKSKPYAVRGFLYATEHGLEDLSNWKESYLEHIKKNEKTYIKLAEESIFLVRLMIREQLLSAKGVATLLKSDALQNDAEIKAELLNYKNGSSTNRSKHEGDPLDDDSAEMKQLLKKQLGQKQIREQNGIEGLVFVASGKFENFGSVDEYTGARDLSDLKRFIEARGGFLRSAVSSKTDYLICNETSVRTAKVQKAEELGTKIISEKEFLEIAE